MRTESMEAKSAPRPFDAPMLAESNTHRVVARLDATAERRRHDLGFQQGYTEGHSRASAEVANAIADHRRNAERLGTLCNALERATQQTLDPAANVALEEALVDMAVQIAEVIVHREVTDHGAVVESIRHSLSLRSADSAVVRLHPDDMACATEARDAQLIGAAKSVELVADPTVGRGGCITETGSSQIDAQVGPALARVRAALVSS